MYMIKFNEPGALRKDGLKALLKLGGPGAM